MRVVLITGAASGIGRAMALEFAALGDRVVATDRDEDGARATAERCGEHASACALDVTDAAQIEAVVAQAGGVDVLCSNAGVLDGYASALDTTEELWDRVQDVNLKASWLLAKAVLPHMLEQGRGCILITASVAGMTQALFDDPTSQVHEFIPNIPSATWGQPEEIARLAAFIASDAVPFMHGAAIVADGGWTIR